MVDETGVRNSTSNNRKAWSHGKRHENGSIGGNDQRALEYGLCAMVLGKRMYNKSTI